MEQSLNELEAIGSAERKSKERATLRHFSLTKMLRSSGIRRSPTAHCACGRRISAGRERCLRCLEVRVDAEVKAVPCEARD